MIWLAEEPGAPAQRRIGLYGLQGLGTIDLQQGEFMPIQSALRLETGNTALKAEAVSPEQLNQKCGTNPEGCFWVALDGHVTRFRR